MRRRLNNLGTVVVTFDREVGEQQGDLSWIRVSGAEDLDLARALTTRVKARVRMGAYTWEEVRHIESIQVSCVKGTFAVSKDRLEMLRNLCQLWDIDVRIGEITSHRPIIGPPIVLMKKVYFRILRVLLKDMIRQQRDFNSTVISLLADLTNERSKTSLTE